MYFVRMSAKRQRGTRSRGGRGGQGQGPSHDAMLSSQIADGV